MPIQLWTQSGTEEWVALDATHQVVDRDHDLQLLRTRHSGKRLTFVLVRF
jgi:hypothetical protein